MTPARIIVEVGEWARGSLPEEEVHEAIRDILRYLDLGASSIDKAWAEVLVEARQVVRPSVPQDTGAPKSRVELARLRVVMARREERRPAASYDSRLRAQRMQELLRAQRALEEALEEEEA